MTKTSPLEFAIQVAGGQAELAKKIGTSRQVVAYWVKTGKPSPRFAAKIEKETGVATWVLCPDVFKRPENDIS